MNAVILTGNFTHSGRLLEVGAAEPMSVFEFVDFRSFLEHVRCHYPGLRRPITLERWAKKLGYNSPRSIAMVLKGQRLPSTEFVVAIARDLKLSDTECRFLELLVRKEKQGASVDPALAEEIEKLIPNKVRRKAVEGEIFSYVASWRNYVIMQLVQTPGFKSDAAWIARRLRGSLSTGEVNESLALLERLGLLQKDVDGKIRLSESAPLITSEDIPSAAIRKHHVEQMEQARQALESQPMLEREFTSLTMRVRRERLPEIKKALREFRDRFDKDFFDEKSADVCQLNLQFFFHTGETEK